MRFDDRTVQGYEQCTIGKAIRQHAELRPKYPAIIASGFRVVCYGELQDQIDKISACLRHAGLDRNARIGIALPDGPKAALAIVAVACSAVAVPLNPKQTLAEIEMCLAVLRLDAILLFQGSDSAARRVAERQGLAILQAIPAIEGALGFKIVVPQIRTAAPADEPNEPDPDAPAFIVQTSGTSAEPKLIPYSHRNMLAAAARCQIWFDLTSEDRSLSVSPVFYAHGLKVTVFTPLLTGGAVTFPIDASKFDYYEWFSVLKPTWYSAGPTLHRLVFDQIKSKTDAKARHSLRFVLSSGAPLPRNVLEGLQHTLGVPVIEHYSSSEASLIAANLPKPGCPKLGTCGVPWPDTVIIIGEYGRRLAPGEQGEILVTGPTVISGYLNAPELNRATFVDGWFRTSDIGSLDEDGFLTLHGRKDDLINRGGEKISPIEIDNVLMRHPAIAEAAAFSVPHPRLGEDIAAAVVLRLGMTATPVELRRYLQEKVALFKVPRRILIRDQLPKGGAGKVLRRQLSESLSTEAEVRPAVLGTSINSNLLFQLRELWESLLNSGPLTIDDDFFEKGGDSLLATQMLIELELLTGQTVPSSMLFEAATIRQLAHKLSEGDDLQAKPLIPLSSNGSQAPLFFFHGDYNGGAVYLRRLATLLGSDQPLFVIFPHGFDGGPIPQSFEDMAADRLSLILEVEPKGPYRLGGHCKGALVAFETARLLVEAGHKVEVLAMIDPIGISAHRPVQMLLSGLSWAKPIFGQDFLVWTLRRLLELEGIYARLSVMSWANWRKMVKRRLQTIAFGAGQFLTGHRRAGSGAASNTTEPADVLARDRKYSIALTTYFPAPLAVRVLVFASNFDGRAWRKMSPDFELINLFGDSNSSWTTTHVAAFANRVRDRLRGIGDPKLEANISGVPYEGFN
jgi:acyl-CoA synthetase (AMP-forming)/AMP-acid ligase II